MHHLGQVGRGKRIALHRNPRERQQVVDQRLHSLRRTFYVFEVIAPLIAERFAAFRPQPLAKCPNLTQRFLQVVRGNIGELLQFDVGTAQFLCLSCQGKRETFKHAMIIDEAHRILLRRTGAGSGGEAVTDTILREIRELGEAIALIDQHPSLISIPAMGNTYTTIALNVKHASDVNALGGAMLLGDEEKDFVGRLPIGQAMVKLQGRWLEPFLIRIPHRKIPKGAVSDTLLIQQMAARNVLKPYEDFEAGAANDARERRPANADDSGRKDGAIKLTEKERGFLLDVLEHPLSGAVERYPNLGLSRRKGNAIREACVQNGLLGLVDIKTSSGKCVLTELTDKGKNALRSLGIDVPERARWGSLEHEYWKHKVADKLRTDGWSIVIEEPVNGYTDIIAEKDGRRVAIEIETGKSDWRGNLQKNLAKGFKEILVVATSAETYQRIAGGIENNPKKTQIWVKQAQQFAE